MTFTLFSLFRNSVYSYTNSKQFAGLTVIPSVSVAMWVGLKRKHGKKKKEAGIFNSDIYSIMTL